MIQVHICLEGQHLVLHEVEEHDNNRPPPSLCWSRHVLQSQLLCSSRSVPFLLTDVSLCSLCSSSLLHDLRKSVSLGHCAGSKSTLCPRLHRRVVLRVALQRVDYTELHGHCVAYSRSGSVDTVDLVLRCFKDCFNVVVYSVSINSSTLDSFVHSERSVQAPCRLH